MKCEKSEMREREIKRLADIIQSEVGYFNGWSVTKGAERDACQKAATRIMRRFDKAKHPNDGAGLPRTESMQTKNQAGEVVAEAKSKAARVIQLGIKIVWGYNEAPKLPDTWRIERTPQAAAVAVSPDGNEYLIGDGVLYPYLKCPPEGLPPSSLKPGQRYMDTVKAIKVPA